MNIVTSPSQVSMESSLLNLLKIVPTLVDELLTGDGWFGEGRGVFIKCVTPWQVKYAECVGSTDSTQRVPTFFNRKYKNKYMKLGKVSVALGGIRGSGRNKHDHRV